uniref:Uncharacterized protein n=1 Tax=Tanacetum cinerariifolium TaxID=118510 RepID=A0A6L2LGX4_TANCI|nr:hypothetical protein [Tanacetum cinerariifolium]
MWKAIKSRFGGNNESKKMHKYLLKQQFEGTTASSSNTQNVAFVSTENTSRTNDVITTYSVSSPSVSKSQKEGSSSYTDEVIHFFFANQSSAPQLDYDDLEQINDDDIEEIDLKWQVAMISMRIKKFHKRTGRKLQFDTNDPVSFDKTKVECFSCQKCEILLETAELKGTKTAEEEMLGTMETKLETMVEDLHIWMIQKLWLPLMNRILIGLDMLRKMLRTMLRWLTFPAIQVLTISILSYENEVLQSVFMNKASDLEDTPVNDRYADRMHAVPPLMIGNHMTYGPDVEIDYSKFTYGPKQTLTDESDSKPSEYASCESDSSVETSTSMPEPVENTSKDVCCKPKVWTDAPIIEEYESHSDNNSVSNVQEDKEKPSFAFTDSVKHVKTSRENIKKHGQLITVLKLRSRIEMLTLESVWHMLSPEKHALFVNDPHRALKDKGIVDSGCSRHMTGNKAHLADYQEFKGGSVAFGEELKHYNLFSVSQMCDKKNKVLFTDTDCLVLSPDFRLPNENQAKEVNTTCYVLNRVLVTKPQKKTHYELLTGFLVGYSLNSKAFRVYNLETKRVKENLHVNFLENKPNVAGKGHAWMFDLDYLTNFMNYKSTSVENQANKSAGPKEANNSAGTQANDDQGANSEEIDLNEEHFVLPIWSAYSITVKSLRDKIEKNTDFKTCENPVSQVEQVFLEELKKLKRQEKEANDAAESLRKEATHDIQNASTTSTNLINTASTPLSTAGPLRAFNDGKLSYLDDPSMPHIEDIYARPSEGIFIDSSYDDEGVTRSKVNKNSEAHALISQALEDKSWVDAMQEEGIDYDEVFAHVAKIEAIRIFLAFASYMGFIVYQMGLKSAFFYDTIDEEVYVSQPLGFVDPKFPNKVYKVVKALYGLHQAPRAWKNRFQMSSMGELTFFLGLHVKQKEDGIFISQDKYIAEILKKFDFLNVKTASTPIETQKPLVKDKEAVDMDVLECHNLTWKPTQTVIMLVKILTGNPQQEVVNFLNPVFHSKTKHIEISHHFIRDAYKKKLIQVLRIHTDDNVADLLTKAFDDEGSLSVGLNTTQQMVINSPCLIHIKNWLVQNQTVSELASPKQMTLGKDISHPLMAGRLPKTTLPTSYALTASPTICTSCIKQFWTTTKVKTINDEVRIQALIDENRVNIKESSIHRTLKLDDAEVKNIKARVPFFMFPRFVQLLINHQLGDMSHHKDIYDNPSLTKKVFANMKRVGTGFSGVVTPLFDNMLIPDAEEVGLIQNDKQQTQAPKVPSPEPSPEHKLPSPFNDPLPGGDDSLKLKELMDLCTHLSNKVLELESEVIDIKSTYKERIKKLKGRVARLKEENKVFKDLHNVYSKVDTTVPVVEKENLFKQERIIADIDEDVEINLEEAQAKLYRIDLEHPGKALSMQDVDNEEPADVEEVLEVVKAAKMGVVIQDPEETTSTVVVHLKVQSKDKDILIEEPKSLKGQAQIEQDEAFARKLEAELNTNINWNAVIEQVKRSESKIRPLFEKHYNYNQTFLEEVNEEVIVPEKEVEVKAHKREEATPLASKIPIVDYKIHFERNKPYLKIIRADGNHMLFLSFSTMLKNFDREDLESLWKLVKERFDKTKPKNYTDDYLLKTLKRMFEQPDVKASV